MIRPVGQVVGHAEVLYEGGEVCGRPSEVKRGGVQVGGSVRQSAIGEEGGFLGGIEDAD